MNAPCPGAEGRERWQMPARLASFNARRTDTAICDRAIRDAEVLLRRDRAVASIARNRGVGVTALTNAAFPAAFFGDAGGVVGKYRAAIRDAGDRPRDRDCRFLGGDRLHLVGGIVGRGWRLTGRRRATATAASGWAVMGVSGFVVSMLLCGFALFAGLKGWIGGVLTFGMFAMFRAIYGGFGCATPSATQAYLASKTRRSGRVAALSALSSSFGLGTIIGPAVAPLFVLPAGRARGAAVRVLCDRAGGRHRDCPVAAERPRRPQSGARRGDELSVARHPADRRERDGGDRSATG